MKKVTVFKPTDIPPIDREILGLQVSKRYYAKAFNRSKEVRECMALYDFKNQKWTFSSPGLIELIEYYTIN